MLSTKYIQLQTDPTKSEYHVWDYKTGSSYVYEKGAFVRGGEQLQHCLYTVAVEEYFKRQDKDAKVTKSGYLLTTEKGTKEGKDQMFSRDTEDKLKWQKPLNVLLELISGGVFVANEEGPCKFCDYIDICGVKRQKDMMKAKKANSENIELAKWKELKEYA